MAQKTAVSSPKYSINSRDAIKGFVMAILTPVMTTILMTMQAGNFTIDWKVVGQVAAGALLAYLTKNFFDSPRIVITDPTEQEVKQVESGQATAKVVNKT